MWDLCTDIDKTLVLTTSNPDEINKLDLSGNNTESKKLLERVIIKEMVVNSVPGSGLITKSIVIKRPYLDEFLEFCSEFFENTHFWSAGKYGYVHCLIDAILDTHKKQKSRGRTLTFSQCGYEQDYPVYEYHKPLEKEGFDLSRTLFLDDIKENFRLNKNNGILIPEYSPKISYKGIMKDDTTLLQLMDWLKNQDTNKDVRVVNKKRIFSS